MPRCDPSFRRYYGPELRSVKLQAWCESNGVELKFIQLGKPNQNAFIERFNRTFRSRAETSTFEL
jgi:transposase InsO family protein